MEVILFYYCLAQEMIISLNYQMIRLTILDYKCLNCLSIYHIIEACLEIFGLFLCLCH